MASKNLKADGSGVVTNGGMAAGSKKQKNDSARPPEPTLDGKWEARLRALGGRLRQHEEAMSARDDAEAKRRQEADGGSNPLSYYKSQIRTEREQKINSGVLPSLSELDEPASEADGDPKGTTSAKHAVSEPRPKTRKTTTLSKNENHTAVDVETEEDDAGDSLVDDDDPSEYFCTVDEWGHEVKQPITLEQLRRALDDASSALAASAGDETDVHPAVRSVDTDGHLRPLAIDWGFDSDGYPFIIIGDRGSMPALDETPETDSGLLLEQPGEGTTIDSDVDDVEPLDVSDVAACAGVIASMSTAAEIAKANEVRKNDERLWRAASMAVGLLDGENNEYDEIEDAAAAAIALIEDL